jgi:hypothetical protein
VALPVEGRRLSLAQRVRLATEIVGTYALVRVWLARGGVRHAIAEARRPEHQSLPPAGGSNGSARAAARLGVAVQRTLAPLPFDSRCLVRSLVLTRVLARRGIESRIVLGVQSEPAFAAHAWVEHLGMPLLPPGTGYHRLTEM